MDTPGRTSLMFAGQREFVHAEITIVYMVFTLHLRCLIGLLFCVVSDLNIQLILVEL